jgi:hypothetical protein
MNVYFSKNEMDSEGLDIHSTTFKKYNQFRIKKILILRFF